MVDWTGRRKRDKRGREKDERRRKKRKRNRSCLRESAERAEEINSADCSHISGIHTFQLLHDMKRATSIPFIFFFTSCSIMYIYPPALTPLFNCTFHSLASACSLHPFDLFPLFHLLFPSLTLSLSPAFPADV